jgi:hypothetical protein
VLACPGAASLLNVPLAANKLPGEPWWPQVQVWAREYWSGGVLVLLPAIHAKHSPNAFLIFVFSPFRAFVTSFLSLLSPLSIWASIGPHIIMRSIHIIEDRISIAGVDRGRLRLKSKITVLRIHEQRVFRDISVQAPEIAVANIGMIGSRGRAKPASVEVILILPQNDINDLWKTPIKEDASSVNCQVPCNGIVDDRT